MKTMCGLGTMMMMTTKKKKSRGNFNMADIDFYQDDSEDNQDDGGDQDDSGLGDDYDSVNPDDLLYPLQKLEKYMDSENIFNRQTVARSLLETIRSVGDNEDDANTVLKAMVKMAQDPEPMVRAELMEQVPHLAMYCQENSFLFTNPISTYILPTVVKYLIDSNNQVRKTSQAALLVLLEQELVDRADMEEQVCPVIMVLSSSDSMDDFRTEAVALMSKMAPLVGKDISERVFMPRFAELCTDAHFHVRKVCAANFGDMCSVVGMESTEEYLLPKFYYLCEDGVWGVRKACAECFMTVSCACTLEVRRNELASLFISLILDQSRWVRMAAFQALGGFISTFADPSITGLYFNEEGVLVAGNPDDFPKSELRTKETNDSIESIDDVFNHSLLSRSTPTTSPDTSPRKQDGKQSNNQGNNQDASSQQPAEQTRKTIVITPSGLTVQEGGGGGVKSNAENDKSNNNVSEDTEPVAMETDESPPSGEGGEGDAPGGVVSHEDVEISVEESRAQHLSEKQAEEGSSVDASPGGQGTAAPTSQNTTTTSLSAGSAGETGASGASDTERSGASSSNTCDTQKVGNADNLSNSNNIGNSNDVGNDGNSADSSNVNVKAQRPGSLPVDDFNSFAFWRDPLPEIDIDADLSPNSQQAAIKAAMEAQAAAAAAAGGAASGAAGNVDAVTGAVGSLSISGSGSSQAAGSGGEENGGVHVASVRTTEEETVTNIGSTHVLGQHLSESTMTVINGVVKDVGGSTSLSYSPHDSMSEERELENIENLYLSQDVIPQALLDHYLSMTDPARAQTVDTDIARHCAYSFPAVAYTLGRKYWPCLKHLYETLAADMQDWKVRRTLAFSIHELAVIVGEENTTRDLVPVFNGFLKDLDEVRIGVLKHLADFLSLLTSVGRRDYLSKLPDFLNTDNNRNWRFREELAGQLTALIEMYTSGEISEHLLPITLALAEDKVAEVRHMAFRVLSGMLKKFSGDDEEELAESYISDVIERFAHSKKWNRRQIYAQLCYYILEDNSLTAEQFANELLPSLLSLGSDKIPNVRIALAKVLAQHIMHSEYFTGATNPHHEDLLKTIQSMQADCDRDVRYFVCKVPDSERDIIPNMIPV